MTRAVDLLRNKFGISQLYKHDVIKNDEVIFSVYWHPLTIAERESIIKKSGTPTMGGLMILIGIIVSTLLWADLKNIYIWT